MPVKAWLEGELLDLEELLVLFTDSDADARVLKDDEDTRHTYYLISPALDVCESHLGYEDAARPLIAAVNGLARVRNSSFSPVRLSNRYTDDNGQNYVFGSIAPLVIRLGIGLGAAGYVVGPDGIRREAPQPESPWPTRLKLAMTNSNVAEALQLIAKEPLGWDDLYKVHEIIRADIFPDTIFQREWTDKATDSAFTGSANRADVSGEDARHARNPGPPPKRTMKIHEGRAYISRVTENWLNALSQH